MKPLNREELGHIAETTVAHYNDSAQSFWEGTCDHDVSQNVEALLRHLPSSGSHRILDFGCGPGRDLATFRDLGHQAVGLDGAEQFVQLARLHSRCEVWQQDFLHLNLPADRFDGIFANAVLFHVPGQELPRILQELWLSLQPGGVLFSSNPHGANQEGWHGNRYGCYLDWSTYQGLLSDASFIELEHYYRPQDQPRHLQPWLASVWRKPEG